MNTIKTKQIKQLQLQRLEQEQAQRNALAGILQSNETLAITLQYCQQILSKGKVQNLSQYSPTNISRLIFEQQLLLIKTEFDKLPGRKARIQHFLALMLKTMKFPFEKTPLYLVGLKDMFNEIAHRDQCHPIHPTHTPTPTSHPTPIDNLNIPPPPPLSIDYPSLQRYILGQLVTIKQQQQNTSFQVHFSERKKQDYLLHDNGIKKIYQSLDLKVYLSLDQRAYQIKVYDQQMRNVNKFVPKREKHTNRFPQIIGFDYSELTSRLGMILSDQTISAVHLQNYLTKSVQQFQGSSLNQLVFTTPCKMRQIYFIQMTNRWLTISAQKNNIYSFDMQRVRQQPDKVMSQIKVHDEDLHIELVLQVVSLSIICVVAANTVTFYNETMMEYKYKMFSHHQVIMVFRYCEERNQFYLAGKEKCITVFSISKVSQHVKVWTIGVNRVIADFEVFPYFDTIAIADEHNELRLLHQPSRVCYQQQAYGHIVKSKDKSIRLIKISKTQFILYHTYMLIMQQQKVAIQKDTEYSFLTNCYFDQSKQQLYLSLNNQIVSFSLLHGEIRKNYSVETCNLLKYDVFVVGEQTRLFVVDQNKDIYQVFRRDQVVQGESRKYRKKVGIVGNISCHYDQGQRHVMVIGERSIQQLRNDYNNNFNALNSINFQGFAPILSSSFSPKTKLISLFTAGQKWYQLYNYYPKMVHAHSFKFPKDNNEHEERLIMQVEYDQDFDVIILLSSKSQMHFVGRSTGRQGYLNLQQLLPYKLKDLKFIRFKYQVINVGELEPYLIVYDDTGFFVEVKLRMFFLEQHIGDCRRAHVLPMSMFKDSHNINITEISQQQIQLHQQPVYKTISGTKYFVKAHDKGIVLALKVKVQLMTTVTVGRDGYVKMWGDGKICLFSLKFPLLTKHVWNMRDIEQIRNQKSVKELLTIFKASFSGAIGHPSPQQLAHKSKKNRNKPEVKTTSILTPFRIDFQNKDLQQLVLYESDYSAQQCKTPKQNFLTSNKLYQHPWRKKKQFMRLYNKATSMQKDYQKIPQDLLQLRSSLDMADRIIKPQQGRLLILPQLNNYQPEIDRGMRQQVQLMDNQEEIEAFQSCAYVKSQRRRKKKNQFDEIDKEFKRKDLGLTTIKWVPKRTIKKNQSIIQTKLQKITNNPQQKRDLLKSIETIFDEHNKDCTDTYKGRIIRMPHIHFPYQRM